MRKMFVMYDGRARCGETEDATVLDTANSEREILKTQKNLPRLHPKDSVWYEYDLDKGVLKNGKMRADLDEKMSR